MGVRLRRSPGVTALGLSGRGLRIVGRTGLPLRGPGISRTDIRLVFASGDATGPDEADPLAVGLSVPLGWIEEGESETTAA
jgi:hypothetical protein